MRKTVLFSLILLAGSGQTCWSQFIRVPVRVPVMRPPVVRPPVIVPHPVYGPGQNNLQRQGQGEDRPGDWSGGGRDEWSWGTILTWVGGGVAGVAGIVGGVWLIRKWRTAAVPRALVRIHSMPPGEAPEWVRSAWIGLELPLIIGQVRPEGGPAQQAVSRRPILVLDGYAVDGKAAVAILESANSEAGKWWREHTPVAQGAQLVFPSYVCERLDDLGQ